MERLFRMFIATAALLALLAGCQTQQGGTQQGASGTQSDVGAREGRSGGGGGGGSSSGGGGGSDSGSGGSDGPGGGGGGSWG